MQADIDSVKKSLEEAKEDVEQLKLSEAERKLENLQLKKDVLELQMKLKDSHQNFTSPILQVVKHCDTEEETTRSKEESPAQPILLRPSSRNKSIR